MHSEVHPTDVKSTWVLTSWISSIYGLCLLITCETLFRKILSTIEKVLLNSCRILVVVKIAYKHLSLFSAWMHRYDHQGLCKPLGFIVCSPYWFYSHLLRWVHSSPLMLNHFIASNCCFLEGCLSLVINTLFLLRRNPSQSIDVSRVGCSPTKRSSLPFL